MIPQLTVYTKILYLLMVVIAGSLCSREQVHLYSKCANRFVGMHEGKIVANDDPVTSQTISISDQMSRGSIILGPLKLTLFIEEAKMYLCFNKKWRLVPSKKLHEYCYFYENMEEGYHRFKSVTDDTKHIGFTANGRQMTFRNRTIHNENCYSFTKITPKQLKASKTAMSSSSTISSSSTKPKVTYMGSPLNGMTVGESQQNHQNHHHHSHHQQKQQQQQQHPHRQQPRNKQHPQQQQQQQHHKKQRHQRISKSSIISSMNKTQISNKNKTQNNLSNHHHQYHQQKQQQQQHHRHRHSQNKHQLPFHDPTSSPSKIHNFQSDQSEQSSADIIEQRIRAERTFRDNMHSVHRSHNNYRGTHNSHSYHYLQNVDVAMDEMPTHHQLSGEMAAVAEVYTANRSLFTTTPVTTTTITTITTTKIDTTNAMNVVPNKKDFRIKKKSHLDKHLGNTQKLNDPYTTMHRHRHHHGDYHSLTSAQYVDKMSKHSKRIHHRRPDDSLNKSSDPVRSV